jgi:hypothetical protein
LQSALGVFAKRIEAIAMCIDIAVQRYTMPFTIVLYLFQCYNIAHQRFCNANNAISEFFKTQTFFNT